MPFDDDFVSILHAQDRVQRTTMNPPAPRSSQPTRRRVLLVAYSFPPVGGAGVQRPTKWTKYLPQFGWDVTVLTVANPSVPVRDPHLEGEVPSETRILRARTLEPGYGLKQALKSNSSSGAKTSPRGTLRGAVKRMASACLQPDSQILWVPNALQLASRELAAVPHDAILVTAPPYSSCLVGMRLAMKFRLPLILDFRDEWDLSNRYLENASSGAMGTWIQQRMQRSVLRSADVVLATTRSSTSRLAERVREAGHHCDCECIYNGWDDDDFASASPVTPVDDSSVFRLVYTGTLWNLTDIRPFVEAAQRVADRAPNLLSRLSFTCLGRKTEDQTAHLDRLLQLLPRGVSRDYVPHGEIPGWLASADATLMLLSDVPGSERVVPAKLFEYLASGSEVLTLAPPGEASDLAACVWPDSTFQPGDTERIANWLIERLSSPERHRISRTDDRIQPFSRRSQSARLVAVLDRACGIPEEVGPANREALPC